jgi:WD40 repeat protein
MATDDLESEKAAAELSKSLKADAEGRASGGSAQIRTELNGGTVEKLVNIAQAKHVHFHLSAAGSLAQRQARYKRPPINWRWPWVRRCAQLHGVPNWPSHYFSRPEAIRPLKAKLLKSVKNLGPGMTVGIQGMGGIGKTVLAIALANDSGVRKKFPDGVHWITVGQKPELLLLQATLLQQLTGVTSAFTSIEEGANALRQAFNGLSALLVLDDVWKVDDAEAFDVTTPPNRLLVTTRNEAVLRSLGAEEQPLNLLSPSEALHFLAGCTDVRDSAALPAEANTVAKECGYLPLALAMIGAMIGARPNPMRWNDALTRLRQVDLDEIKRASLGYAYPNLLRAINASIEDLEPSDRDRYLDLAVFPEDQPIPEGPLRALWSLNDLETRDCMERLATRSLAFWAENGRSLFLHDLQRDLIFKCRQDELPGLHGRLVDGLGDPRALRDPYAWQWLPWHLREAGRVSVLRQLLGGLDWIEAKLHATDVNMLINDYDYLPAQDSLRLVQDALRLSAPAILADKEQLRPQLSGRLFSQEVAEIRALLKSVLLSDPPPWLRPLSQSLRPPGGHLEHFVNADFRCVWAMAITSDAHQAITASSDGNLRLWDLVTGQLLHTLRGHKQGVTSVALTRDGQRALSGSEDCTLKLWDLKVGREIKTFKGHRWHINAVATTRDGQRAVSGASDGMLKLWNLITGDELLSLDAEGQVSALAVDAEGHLAVSATTKGTLKVWSLRTGNLLHNIQAHRDPIRCVSLTADGHRVVCASDDGSVTEWSTKTGSCFYAIAENITSRVEKIQVGRMAIAADGRLAICRNLTRPGSFIVWDLEKRASVCAPDIDTGRYYGASIYALAVTPDGRRAVSSSDNDVFMVWNFASGKQLEIREDHLDTVNELAAGGNCRAVTASNDKTLKVWDLHSCKLIHTLIGHNDTVDTVAVTQDGRFAVSGSSDHTLKLWELDSGQLAYTFEGHAEAVNQVTVTPDGRLAASCSDDCTVKVWDLNRRLLVWNLIGHTESVIKVSIDRKGRRGVSITKGRLRHEMCLWDIENGRLLHELKGHKERIAAVTMTADGGRVISGSADQTIKIWDVESGRLTNTFSGHNSVVRAVALTPDACLAVSGSWDRNLKVWDLRGMKEVRTLRGHASEVVDVSLTHDGRQLVSISRDRILKVWNPLAGVFIAGFVGESELTHCMQTGPEPLIVVGERSGRVHFLKLEGTTIQ